MAKSRNSEKASLKVTLLITSMMTVLGGAMLSPALPAIRDQFGDLPNVDYLTRFVVTLPAFFIAANAPVAGYIVDRFGRMNVLVASLILAGLAGTSGYIAPTLPIILVGRGFLGIAAAGIMTSTTTLIADYYTGEVRARFMGLQTGMLGIGGTLFLTLSGVLADVNWRTPFLIYLVAFVVLPFALLFLYEPHKFNRYENDPPLVGEPGTCAGESVHLSTRTSSSIPDYEPPPIRLIAFIYGIVLLAEIVYFIIPLQLPFYLQELTDASATQNGVAISFITLSFSLSSIFLGKAMARRDHISVLMLSLTIYGAGYGLVFLAGATVALYLGLIVAGVGLGMLIPNLYVWLANETPVSIRGRTMGGFTTALFLGGFLSPILTQPVINTFDIGSTILIAGAALILLVPFLFAGRGKLKALTA